jgi:hypothetical protein
MSNAIDKRIDDCQQIIPKGYVNKQQVIETLKKYYRLGNFPEHNMTITHCIWAIQEMK